MSRWAPVLQRHMEDLLRLNEKLLEAVEARKAAMIARDARKLEALLADEGRISRAIAEEEQRRRVTMLRLGGELARTPEQMAAAKLAEVAPLLGPPYADRLLQLRDGLRRAARRAREANHATMILAQQLLPHFQELLEIVLTGAVGQRAYTAEGQAVRTPGPGMNVLDVRV